MGIKDLLRFMKPYILPIHIQKYAGKRVGIDAYSWLHKGAYSCSMELCLDTDGKKKLRYIDYFMHRVNLLQHYEIIPVVVLDGGNMPCKAATGDERHRQRKANFDAAMVKLKEGNVGAATELFQRAVSVTSSMAHQLIQVLKSENVEFIVAPYEADAQLAYLSSLDLEHGGIAAVITEDSDLLAYGCKAVIFKMDRYGKGEELILDNVFQAVDQKPSFQNFDQELFTAMCVLAGCDFLPSVPGVGISRAHAFISKYQSVERVLSFLKTKKGKLVPDDYSSSFTEAVSVFQHARVYDFDAKKLKHLKPLSQNLLNLPVGQLEFLGPDLSPSVAAAVAEGNIDPITMEAFNRFSVPRRQLQKPVRSFKEQEKESSFLVCSSSKSEERIELKRTADEATIDPEATLKKMMYSKQDSDLHKLLSQPNRDQVVIQPSNPSPIPDNNPFKIRKTDEINLEFAEYGLQELAVSFVTKSKAMDVASSSPNSHGHEDRKEGVTIDLPKLEDSGIKQDSAKNRVKKTFETTEVDIAEVQDHVNMTTKRVRGTKPRTESFKVKTSCKSSENKKTTIKKKHSILDFFHRL
ncbi:XPG-I domain [Arabidopsis thaliana x Arabidopsis arenosa]|uniref:Exonuclease 1 n=1 Tax=Arabidopsis thaliana x Arabidopsis arenosa TaxID=1240361 RepID=A0A8T2BZN6_9BRAS|nr:XPG-I domain [Arabidopsis thaliana x Arabidopsis arenosa]